MGGTGKDQIRLNPPLVDEIQTNLAFLHVPIGPLILPLPCLQPTQFIPSNKYLSFDLININLASHKEREGEPKSLRNRRHQENIKPDLHIQ